MTKHIATIKAWGDPSARDIDRQSVQELPALSVLLSQSDRAISGVRHRFRSFVEDVDDGLTDLIWHVTRLGRTP
jgi:hypothetical protein